MDSCERRAAVTKVVAANATPVSDKGVLRLSAPQRQELELLYRQCARPCSAILHQLIKNSPLLSQVDIHLLKAWFHGRRLKEKRDEKLSPLIHKNAVLKAEHEMLVILNNQLKNQAFLLNLENQRLKEQLEIQLQAKQSASPLVPEQPEEPELAKAEDSSDVDDVESGTSRESGSCDLETNLQGEATMKQQSTAFA